MDYDVFSSSRLSGLECSELSGLFRRWFALHNGTGCDTFSSAYVIHSCSTLRAPGLRRVSAPAPVAAEADPPAPEAVPEYEIDPRAPPPVDPKTRKTKSRHWAITIPAPELQPGFIEEYLSAVFSKLPPNHRLVSNFEASSAGWRHLQTYAHFKAQVTFEAIKLALHEASVPLPHWLKPFSEKSVDITKYIKYCQKKVDTKGGSVLGHYDSKPQQVGVERRAGKRTDISSFRDVATTRVLDIMSEPEEIIGPMCKYPRFTSECQAVHFSRLPRLKFLGVCFWGPTSTGKTFRALELAKRMGYSADQIYVKAASHKWWDGFRSGIHTAVIVDEMRTMSDPELITMHLTLMGGMGNAMQVQNKGASVFVNPSLVVYTSPFSPEGFISAGGVHGLQDHSSQFVRRFHRIIECTRVYQPPPVEEVDQSVLDALLEDFPAM